MNSFRFVALHRVAGGVLLALAVLGACVPQELGPHVLRRIVGDQVGQRVLSVDAQPPCRMDAATPVEVAALDLRIPLAQPFRLGGYGLFPFWQAPWFAAAASEPRTDQLTGKLLVVGGRAEDHPENSDPSVWWVLVTLDTLGVAAPLVGALRSGVELAILGRHPGGPKPSCMMTTIAATHSHSGPDLTGVWGAAAQSWSRNQNADQLQRTILPSIQQSLAAQVHGALGQLRAMELSFGQEHVPTSATRQAEGQLPNVDVFRFVSRQPSLDPDPLLWVWDAHATTVPRQRHKADGDFPAKVSAALASDALSIFLVGSPAGQYVRREEAWLESLVSMASEHRQSQPFTLVLQESVVCLVVDAALFPLFESWASRWLGVSATGPECGKDRVKGKDSGVLVTLQTVDFVVAGASSSKQGSRTLASLQFVPFELSLGAAEVLRQRLGLANQISQTLPYGRAVSLANGFLGHGLAASETLAILGQGPETPTSKDPQVVKSYHLWMSLVRSIDDLAAAWHPPRDP